MYIPKDFANHDQASIKAFIQQHSFATLISADENKCPVATHLPFIIDVSSDDWIFYTHISKQNPHKKLFENNNHLVVFQAPHAYISPSFYTSTQNVPTWNYVAVHCYGKIKQLHNNQHKWLLEKSIDHFEKEYKIQWNNLDENYKKNLMNGIIAIAFEVDKVQAKEKLSQNKTTEERLRIAKNLAASLDAAAKETAKYMYQNIEKKNKK